MIKNRYLLSALLLFFAGSAFTQVDTVEVQKEKTMYAALSGMNQNWYIGLGAGTQFLFSEDAENLAFSKRLTPSLALTVGKWISPFFGFRFQAQGTSLNGYSTSEGIYLADPIGGNSLYGNNDPVRNEVDINPDGSYRHYVRYMNLHFDVQVSLMSLISEYKADRKFDIIPSFGMGYMQVFEYKGVPSAGVRTVNCAVMGNYKLSDQFDVNLELKRSVFPDKFEGRIMGVGNESALAINVGVTYRFKKASFKSIAPANPETITEYIYKTQVDTVIVEKVSEPITQIVEKEPFALASILFRLNSASPEKGQKVQYVNIANFMKENPEVKICLEGYADRETGSEEYNYMVSQSRAENIKAILVKDQGIPSERLDVKAFGSVKQPYEEMQNNRVVLAVVL